MADAWTDSLDAEANHGSDSSLRVGVGAGAHAAYLRFDTARAADDRPRRHRRPEAHFRRADAGRGKPDRERDRRPGLDRERDHLRQRAGPAGGTTTGTYNDVVGAGQQITVALDGAPNHGWLRRSGAGSSSSLAITNTAPDVPFSSRGASSGSPTLVVVIQPDPVIAFFGSGTCDPTQARYANGFGTTTSPRQCKGKYVGDALFSNPADPATLKVDVLAAVGDLQPSNGEYVKYCESSVLGVRGTVPCPKGGFLPDKMLGRPSLLPILRATTGNHDYLAGDAGSNSVTDDSCAPTTTYNNAHGYFDSLDDTDKTGPKRAANAWASEYMRSTGTGVPASCNKDRDGSGGYY